MQTALIVSLFYKNDWIFDTATSSYISSNIDKFKTSYKNNGTVKVGGRPLLKYKGKGTCLLYPLLSDNTSSTIQLYNVLFVPTLGHNLISWNILKSRFRCKIKGDDIYIK